LDAIERGDLGAYQSFVFAAGHIRIYARFLRVDPAPYLAALQADFGAIREPPKPPTRPIRRRRTTHLLAPAGLAVVLVALSAYLVLQYTAFVSGSEPLPSSSAASPLMLLTPIPTAKSAGSVVPPTISASFVKEVTAIATLTPATTPTLPPPPATDTPPPVPTKASGVEIEATMVGRVWVQVESDGRVIFSGILNTGDTRRWSAGRQLMLWTGDAANVQVTYNGKSLGRLGSPGQVLKVTWTATS
jgi:cytoskeletal protein RodZ